jgi:transposase
MLRCDKVRLNGDRVSRLWNAANYVCRQAFLAKEGVPVGSKLERRKQVPEYRQLPSDIAQEVLKKLSEAWSSYWKLRVKWTKNASRNQKPGLPKYRKDRRTGERPFDLIPVKHPRSYSVDPKDCHIVLPRDRRRTPRYRFHIAYRGRRRFQGKMGRAEVTFDRVRKRWYFAWSVETADQKAPSGDRCAAVDLGVRLGASLSIEGLPQALHFENREALKDWDFIGREIAREQQAIAAHCRLHSVSKVYLGHPKWILRDVRYGSSTWAGRIHGFWSFDQVLTRIASALEAVGIASGRVGERGSSSTCCFCGSTSVVRNPRWSIRCKDCESKVHSDQAGSRFILKSQKPSVSWAGAEAAPLTETLRWTRHRWDPRSANPGRLASDGVPEFLQAA